MPKLLGPNAIPEYSGYDIEADASASTDFAAVAYTYGISSFESMTRITARKQIADKEGNCFSNIPCNLRAMLKSNDDISQIIMKLVEKPKKLTAADIHGNFFDQLFDLATLNIIKGRDFGVLNYSDMRSYYGLSRPRTFADITKNLNLQIRLQAIYENVENIDAWVGAFCEERDLDTPGSLVGPLFTKILIDQFYRSRVGDRFWYENPGVLSDDDILELTTMNLQSLVLKNTNLKNFPSSPFDITVPSILTISPQNSGSGAYKASSGYTISWMMDPDSNETALTFTLCLNSSYSPVWMSIGFNDIGVQMLGADFILAEPISNPNGSITWNVYNRQGLRANVFPASATNYIDTSTVFDAKVKCNSNQGVTFKRPLNAGAVSIKSNQPTNLIFAFGTTSALESHAVTDRGGDKIDLISQLKCGGQAISGGCPLAVQLETQLVTAHGIVMTFVFLIIFPFGFYQIRYVKSPNSVDSHKMLMFIGTTLASFTIIAMFLGMKDKLAMTHAILGLVLYHLR